LPIRGTLTEPGDREPREFWQPAKELTRNGGRVAVSYYSSKTLDNLFSILKDVFDNHEPPRYFYREMGQSYSESELKDQMEKRGLKVISSGVDPLRPNDLKTGKDILEFLECSLPAVDFSFISAPNSTMAQLETGAIIAFDKALKEGKISFDSISIVAIK
jgi:hypothetical protein